LFDNGQMQIYAVREVTARLRDLLASDSLLNDVWIAGECSNVSRPASGHVYFTLKDPGAQLRAVFFANPRAQTSRLLENGAAVLAHGRIGLYEQRGDLQVVVDYVQPEGAGALQAEFERLKAQLEEEGLFDESRKRSLPRMPRHIGVVTSASGAVFHDICTVLERRWPLAEITLAPAPVQGPEAVSGVIGGIGALNDLGDVDVIIVARGGGSIEELWAFNDVSVARAIFASAAPVVSAVGHETDVTIADFVADLRAPTPSAAAELVSPDRLQLQAHLLAANSSIDHAMTRISRSHQDRISNVRLALQRHIPDVARHQRSLADLLRRAHAVPERKHRDAEHLVGSCVWRLKSLSPYATLDRGYAIVQKDKGVVSVVGMVKAGDALDVRVKDGTFGALVGGASPVQRRRPRRPVPEAQVPLFTMPEDRI
jgi:exodeoxyribonuclease VII large subunit